MKMNSGIAVSTKLSGYQVQDIDIVLAGRLSKPRARSGLVKRNKRELEQLHLLLGTPAFPDSFERRYPLYVLNTILGGTMSSRLFQKIREERGLVYSVYSAVNSFVDVGFLNVYAATGPDKGDEVLDLVLEELRDLAARPTADEELRVAKEHLQGSLMLSLESTSSRMSNLARGEIYHGRQLTLAETLRGVEGVTAKRIHALARAATAEKPAKLNAYGM